MNAAGGMAESRVYAGQKTDERPLHHCAGRVRLATHMSTGQQAAVKIVPRQVVMNSRMSLRDAGTKQEKITLGIEREIVIMKLIEHPNLLGLWDVYETAQEL